MKRFKTTAEDIKGVQISLTHLCNSNCRFCVRHSRNVKEGTQLSKKQIDNLLSTKLMENLKRVLIVGNTGEPVLGKNFKYLVKKINTHVHISTNGSGIISWWKDLAHLNDNMTVAFGIDGLTNDVHQLYRSTDVNMVFRNMKAFVAEGGKAIWKFILFKQNQHQVEDARNMAEKLGVKIDIRTSWQYDEVLEKPTIDIEQTRFARDICKFEAREIFVRSDGFMRICCHQVPEIEKICEYETMNLSDFTADEIVKGKDFRRQLIYAGTTETCQTSCNYQKPSWLMEQLKNDLWNNKRG